MKNVEVVVTTKGWHVTRRYCGRSIESKFFSTVVKDFSEKDTEKQRKKKIEKAYQAAEIAKDDYIREWVGA